MMKLRATTPALFRQRARSILGLRNDKSTQRQQVGRLRVFDCQFPPVLQQRSMSLLLSSTEGSYLLHRPCRFLHSDRLQTNDEEKTRKDNDDDSVTAAANNEKEAAELESTTSPNEQNARRAPAPSKMFSAYISNLSYETDEDDLKGECEKFGTVTNFFMPRERTSGRIRGIAFVSMSSQEELDSMIASINESYMDGRTIFACKAESRVTDEGTKETRRISRREDFYQRQEGTKLFVGNIRFDTTEEELATYLSGFGRVTRVLICKNFATKEPKGYAFVTMHSEDAEKVIAATHDVEFQGRLLRVANSSPRDSNKPPPPKAKEALKLHVGNLSFDTDEGAIRELFEKYGEIVGFYMPKDRLTDRHRGFAFVTLPPEAAKSAVEEADGYELDGCAIRINLAHPKGHNATEGYNKGSGNFGGSGEHGDYWDK